MRKKKEIRKKMRQLQWRAN